MAASFPGTTRARSWNVQIHADRESIAGIFQRDDLVTITDLAHELELCFILDKPDGDTTWQPALFPRDDESASRKLIILDHQDEHPIPTPTSSQVDIYTFVFHSSSQCRGGDQHSLHDHCIRCVEKPKRRADPRYLEIGKQSCPSSPAKTDSPDEPGLPRPDIVSTDTARSRIDSFRTSVLALSNTCLITGKGKCSRVPLLAGPGLEAAHIVPQIHWNTFPIDSDGVTVAKTIEQLTSAWLATWTATNGFVIMSHLHKCFDLRLFSIHPIKHTVRAFIDYDLLVDYHGRKVDIPSDIDQRALQHHWDMCCLENIPSSLLPYSSAVVIDIPELRGPAINTSQGNPSKGAFPHASDSQVSATHKADTQASSTQASDTLTASDMQSLRLSSFLASASQACLPSPPPSKPSSEGQKLWRLGHKVIKDPARAVELWRQGHNIVAVESDTEGSDEERGRTHSPVQLPCVGAISSGQEETRGVVNGSKKQRLQ